MKKNAFLLFIMVLGNGLVHAQIKKALTFTRPHLHARLQRGTRLSFGEYISSTDNITVNASLFAIDKKKTIPAWLSVNEQPLNRTNYTINSEISFTVDATNLVTGDYKAFVTASAAGYTNAAITICITVIPPNQGTL